MKVVCSLLLLCATGARAFGMGGLAGMGNWMNGKPKHEWTYEEFLKHKEEGITPRGGILSNINIPPLPPASPGAPPPPSFDLGNFQMPNMHVEVTEEHHEFRKKPDHEKQAHYDDFIANSTAEHEQKQYENTLRYKLYWLMFHWRDGALGLLLFLLKVLAIGSGCYCLCQHKAKRSFADMPNSAFKRKGARKVD